MASPLPIVATSLFPPNQFASDLPPDVTESLGPLDIGGHYFSDEVEVMFHCAACRTRIRPPTKICSRGHMVCRRCFRPSKRCPVCRRYLDARRNLVVDRLAKLIPLPCAHAEYGCRAAPMAELARRTHEFYCRHRPLTCLSPGCLWKEDVPVCEETRREMASSLAALRLHVERAHPWEAVFVAGRAVSVVTDGPPRTLKHLLSHGGDAFLVVVELRKSSKGLHLRAGVAKLDIPTRNPPDYTMTILVTGGVCEITYKAPIVSYMQVWPGPMGAEGWVLERPYMHSLKLKKLKKYMMRGGCVKVSFIIGARNDGAE